MCILINGQVETLVSDESVFPDSASVSCNEGSVLVGCACWGNGIRECKDTGYASGDGVTCTVWADYDSYTNAKVWAYA